MAIDVHGTESHPSDSSQAIVSSNRTRTKVRIFVASPGDVSDERNRLTRIVEQLNRGVADKLGLVLELLRWETHIAPDVGRPQGVVFSQLPPSEWDIFIGILWLRFGSGSGEVDPETNKMYSSGTEEEFKSTYHLRMASTTPWPKIMFYRCIRPPTDMLHFDNGQFARVQNFFEGFTPSGSHPGLFRTFEEADDFERQVHEHLEKWAWEFAETIKPGHGLTPAQPMEQVPRVTTGLPPVDRVPERQLFRAILTAQTMVRGLVVHSRGDGGWGKSILLEMFARECSAVPNTICFSFDPSDAAADWKSIMDQTARKVGSEYFLRYLNASASGYSKEMLEGSSLTGTFSLPEGSASGLHGGFESSSAPTMRPIAFGVERSAQFQLGLTEIFVEDMESLAQQLQIVWLIDGVDWIDRETQAWLIKIFGRIANEKLKKLVVVIASRDALYYQPSWKGRIEELDVCRFDKSAILELLVMKGWIVRIEGNETMCEAIAEDLIKITKGNPLEICTLLDRGRPGWRP